MIILNCGPLICTMDHAKFVVSKETEEFISIQKVKEATKLENIICCKFGCVLGAQQYLREEGVYLL